MEVVVPAQDFQFEISPPTTTNPFTSAPSSPSRATTNPFELSFASPNETTMTNPFDLYNHYSSAPASPTRAAAIYAHFNTIVRPSFSTSSAVPFDWEESPGTPKSRGGSAMNLEDSDFEFDGNPEKGKPPPEPTSADELFEKGRIRPLKPPPPSAGAQSSVGSSPRSPRVKVSWSPRRRWSGQEVDPFVAAMVEATKDSSLTDGNPNPSPDPSQPSPLSTKPNKKWRLSDLLLFRSASDARIARKRSKDPIFNYSAMSIFNSSSVSPSLASKKAAGGEELKEETGTSNAKAKRKGEAKAVVLEEEGKTTKAKAKAKAKSALHHRKSLMSCFRFNPALHRIGSSLTTQHNR